MSLEIRQQIKIKGSTLSEDPVLYFDNTGSGESLASITVDSFGGGSSGELIFNYAQTNVLTESFRINQSGNLAMASSGNKIISNAIDPRANAIYNIGATGNSYANIYSQYLWADQSIKLGFSGFGNISASNGTGAGVIINGPGSGANDSMMKLQTELFYKGLIIQDSEISGVTRIDASAILELNSPTRGFRPPRNPDPVTNIVSPTNGLMAYDSTDDELQYYNGTSWVSLNDTAGAFLPLAGGTMSGDIDMDGNAIDFGGILGSITNPIGILTIQSNKNTTIDANGNTYDFSDGPPVITITGNGMTPGSLVMDASDGTIQATVSAIENILDLSTLPTSNRYWEMPDADGTVALTSDLGDYLPLAGGTMAGDIDMDGNAIHISTGDKIQVEGGGAIEISSDKGVICTAGATANHFVNSSTFKYTNADGEFISLSPANVGGIARIGATDEGTAFSGSIAWPVSLSAATQWNLPDASGTIALTSDLTGFLPLAGGTMSGDILFTAGDINLYDGDAGTASKLKWNDDNYIEVDVNGPGGLSFYADSEWLFDELSTTRSYILGSGAIGYYDTGVSGALTFSNITGARNWTLPDATGTIALTSDIPTFTSIEYTALLTQVGTSAPTESVLNDTLTGGTWSYSSVGNYHYTKVGAFTNVNKVEVRIESHQFNFFTMTNNAYNMMSASRLDNDTILVKTANVGYVAGSGKGLTDPTLSGTITDFLVDDVLNNTPITIRVWS